jgi:hypothetical protein
LLDCVQFKQEAIGSAGKSNKQQVTNFINKKCEEVKRQKKKRTNSKTAGKTAL